MNELAEEVKKYEPKLALDGGPDGLQHYRSILAQLPMWGDRLIGVYFEIGYKQSTAVSQLLTDRYHLPAKIIRDLGGNERVVYTLLGVGQ